MPTASTPDIAKRMGLFCGTSGWAYPTWKPAFYPKSVPAKKFLEHYGSRLTSVEVNYTFRTLPTVPQLEGWIASARGEGLPLLGAAARPEFRFSFKAPQGITHFKRLRDCGPAVEAFFAALQPARDAGAMGCVLFQLPPNFKANAKLLAEFLALDAMRGARQVAFEFRNASWFCDEVYTILRAHNAAVCIAESDDLETPESFTADFSCYRLRMAGGYHGEAITAFAEKFASLSRERETYVYFKHEDEPHGPLAADAMLQQIAAMEAR